MTTAGIGLIVPLVVAVVAASPAAARRPVEEARSALAAQVDAWNRGDLDASLDAYWSDDRMTWVHRGGVERGFRSFASEMRSAFGGRPEQMGRYAYEVLDARNVGSASAILVIRWSIDRDTERLMGGVSTQVWRRREGRWRIVLEHAS